MIYLPLYLKRSDAFLRGSAAPPQQRRLAAATDVLVSFADTAARPPEDQRIAFIKHRISIPNRLLFQSSMVAKHDLRSFKKISILMSWLLRL